MKISGFNQTVEWSNLRFSVFDHPPRAASTPLSSTSHPSSLPIQPVTKDDMGIMNILGNLSYEGRYTRLTNSILFDHPFVVLTPQIACTGLSNILLKLKGRG
jgi:hypothetical protein